MDQMTKWAMHPTVRKLVSSLRLPLKLPTVVRREHSEPLLRGKRVSVTGVDLRDTLTLAGATLTHDAPDALIMRVPEPKRIYGLLHGKDLKAHTRLVFLTDDAMSEANRDAVLGFTKSYAKEVGTKAITVNVLDVKKGANADAVIAWFASDRSRYVTGQRVLLQGGEEGTLSLHGKKALVTGGARGIGAAIARTLYRQGAHVTLVDLPQLQQEGSALAGEIGGVFVAGDVTRDNVVQGGMDVLVNNAGITRDKTFAKMTEEKWNQVIEVNYEAAVKQTEHWLAAGNKGTVIFLSSVVGISGNFGQTNYTLSKAAIMGYVRSLQGVRANAVAPGFIDTALTREVPFLNREMSKQMIALLQAGEADDVAEAVAFLAASASSAISGQTIRVDGGMFFGA